MQLRLIVKWRKETRHVRQPHTRIPHTEYTLCCNLTLGVLCSEQIMQYSYVRTELGFDWNHNSGRMMERRANTHLFQGEIVVK